MKYECKISVYVTIDAPCYDRAKEILGNTMHHIAEAGGAVAGLETIEAFNNGLQEDDDGN